MSPNRIYFNTTADTTNRQPSSATELLQKHYRSKFSIHYSARDSHPISKAFQTHFQDLKRKTKYGSLGTRLNLPFICNTISKGM